MPIQYDTMISKKSHFYSLNQPRVVYRIPCGGCNKVSVGETKRTIGEHIKEHMAKIANNLSAIAEHNKKTSHEPNLDNSKVLCREDKLIPCKVRKETNGEGGHELSKIYDLLLETPCSRSGSISRNSATIHWGRRRVSPKYSVSKRWVLVNSFKLSLMITHVIKDSELSIGIWQGHSLFFKMRLFQ